MDSNAREGSDAKAEFRKPSNDPTNRKYRRRSPVGGSSSSSDGSPRNGRSTSPVLSRKETARVSDDKRKRDDDRNQSGRSGESYKHYDRQSSRIHHRHDDRSRRDRNVDDYDRGYAKSSFRSRDNNNLDYSRSDKEHRSRDYVNDADTYSRGKSDGSGYRSRDKDSYDRTGSGRRHAAIEERDGDKDRDRNREEKGDRYGKPDIKKSSADHRSDHSPGYDESRGLRNDSFARRDSSGPRVKETSWRDTKELDSDRHGNNDKRRDDDRGAYKDHDNGERKGHSDDMSIKGQDSKKPKIFSLDGTGPGADGTSEPACVTDSDIDAAKVAAMKAAELVNKNLVGTGYMSTDQKKKLLWGNKKNAATEESAHRWDTPMFGDRDRQEKFNKLMSLRLHWWPIVGREGGCKVGAQDRQPRCGKAARATSGGVGEAIHRWPPSKRWPYSWTRSLEVFFFRYSHACINVFLGDCVKKLVCKTRNVVTWCLKVTDGKDSRYCMALDLSAFDVVGLVSSSMILIQLFWNEVACSKINPLRLCPSPDYQRKLVNIFCSNSLSNSGGHA